MATSATDPPTDLASQVRMKAELAIAQFQQQTRKRLDYSEKSLSAVDEILEEVSRYKAQMSKTNVDTIVEIMSAYILDVAYRQYGGVFQWHAQSEQPVLVIGEPRSTWRSWPSTRYRDAYQETGATIYPFSFKGLLRE